jgi:hypothetical protein
MMGWYAASIVMCTRFKDGRQDKFPVWENVILIQADSDDEALEKANKRGMDDEGDSSGTYYYEDRPATLVFSGIRKIIKTQDSETRPGDGTEITYSQMEVDSEGALSRLVKGEPVTLSYLE